MKMLTMAGAAVAAMLLVAAPAGAQTRGTPAPAATPVAKTAPDPDAMCFLVLSETLAALAEHPELLDTPEKQKVGDRIRIAYGLYVGKLVERYSDAQLIDVFKGISPVINGMPRNDRRDLATTCATEMGPQLSRLLPALENAMRK